LSGPTVCSNEGFRALPFKEKYDLMFLPTGTISHLVTPCEVVSFLDGARTGLRPTGVLALDAHHPATKFLKTWSATPGPEESSFQHRRTKETVRVQTTLAYAPESQIFTVSCHYTFADGSTKDAAIVLRLYFPLELQSLLQDNGFETLSTYGNYTRKEFNAENAKYIVVARKRFGN
jgi:hypothetical protein